jgi:hypothetical protein
MYLHITRMYICNMYVHMQHICTYETCMYIYHIMHIYYISAETTCSKRHTNKRPAKDCSVPKYIQYDSESESES